MSRIIEKGKGVYYDYPCFSKIFCDEFIITGYRPEDIRAVYNLKDKSFHDVYEDLQFGRIEHIKLEEVNLSKLRSKGRDGKIKKQKEKENGNIPCLLFGRKD